ncbi:MAG: hypothetical protein ACD_2C00249G0001 [uncultured bacterium (gcode 4)]|uniref:Uncharacterized protein n=1 Tax=uncultured bacterium (gcode 4) TaxID=1234023 RepID=K2FD14_9BACT|nr:MAG: hypothetical protein ACD_2C00249G0001 [uncultured bacterium (gcode 4)]
MHILKSLSASSRIIYFNNFIFGISIFSCRTKNLSFCFELSTICEGKNFSSKQSFTSQKCEMLRLWYSLLFGLSIFLSDLSTNPAFSGIRALKNIHCQLLSLSSPRISFIRCAISSFFMVKNFPLLVLSLSKTSISSVLRSSNSVSSICLVSKYEYISSNFLLCFMSLTIVSWLKVSIQKSFARWALSRFIIAGELRIFRIWTLSPSLIAAQIPSKIPIITEICLSHSDSGWFFRNLKSSILSHSLLFKIFEILVFT